jgi:hypothetical protein
MKWRRGKMMPTIIKLVEQSYHKIEDIRNVYIKRYGPINDWGMLQYTYLFNADIEIISFLEEQNVTINQEAQDFGVALGMLMIRNEVRMMYFEKYGTKELDMYAKEEMFQNIYECALDFWIHGQLLNN